MRVMDLAKANPPRIVGAADWPALRRGSDNGKFCNDLNEQKTPKMSERPFDNATRFPDFQAEYEGFDSLHPLQRFQ
jgi:hypothetical protein